MRSAAVYNARGVLWMQRGERAQAADNFREALFLVRRGFATLPGTALNNLHAGARQEPWRVVSWARLAAATGLTLGKAGMYDWNLPGQSSSAVTAPDGWATQCVLTSPSLLLPRNRVCVRLLYALARALSRGSVYAVQAVL
jgi:hypothetical protein